MIGVIIQGPLITFGQGPNNSIEGFNSCYTITENIKAINRLGFNYIISTWNANNSDELTIIKQLNDLNLNLITIDSPNIVDPDHRYKHHFGINAGLNELSKDVNFIVKIRTDQLYQNKFWDFMVSISEQDTEKLCISELYYEPFFMGDFIYAGKRSVIEKFIIGFLDYKRTNFHPCLAMDIGIKYYNTCKFKKFPLPLFVYFVFMPNYTRNLWNNFIQDNIIVIPKNVRNGILWRNIPISKIITCDLFRFNSNPIEKNINFLERLFNYITHIKIYLLKAHPKIAKNLRKLKKFPEVLR